MRPEINGHFIMQNNKLLTVVSVFFVAAFNFFVMLNNGNCEYCYFFFADADNS